MLCFVLINAKIIKREDSSLTIFILDIVSFKIKSSQHINIYTCYLLFLFLLLQENEKLLDVALLKVQG